MKSPSSLIQRLVKLIWAKNSATFYLNGAPGSGKSYTVKELSKRLPEEIPRSMILGPYIIRQDNIGNLEQRLMRDCQTAGFLDELPMIRPEIDLTTVWRFFADNAHISTDYTFLILVDLVDADQIDLAVLGRLFSQARQLEGAWRERRIRLFHMFVGYWNHLELVGYFRDISTSFPYTVGDNYAVWEGVSRKEIIRLVDETQSEKIDPMCGGTIFELIDGHPAAALNILDYIDSGEIFLKMLLSATHQAADKGLAGQALLKAWSQLPAECRSVLRQLALKQHISIKSFRDHWQQLHAAGAVQCHRVGENQYLSFRSWYVELLVRLHTEELDIADEQIRKVNMNELMPTICDPNVQAYRLINDIENRARNFVAIRLSLKQSKGHILKGRCPRLDEATDSLADTYQRATYWRAQSLDKGILNPLLAYVSTRDLARIIEEIGREMGSEIWQHIADTILELSDIRDAVMHNQLIDGSALRRIYKLRADIYEALDEC